jgi:anti-anti-sigma regulatory factor
MMQQLLQWLDRLPYTDPLLRRQAALVQIVALGTAVIALALLALPFLTIQTAGGRWAMIGSLTGLLLFSLFVLWQVRGGQITHSALLLAIGLTIGLSAVLYGVGFAHGAVVLFAFSLPLTIGSVLSNRRSLVGVLGASLAGVGVVALLTQIGAPGSGFIAVTAYMLPSTLLGFALVALVLMACMGQLAALDRAAVALQQHREREFEVQLQRLELKVRERSADLDMALATLEQRAAEQERLIEAHVDQASALRELHAPLLPVAPGMMLMPLSGTLDQQRLVEAHEQVLTHLEQQRTRHLLLNLSSVPTLEPLVAQGVAQIVHTARLLGTEVAILGTHANGEQALLAAGLDLATLRSFADLRAALMVLDQEAV